MAGAPWTSGPPQVGWARSPGEGRAGEGQQEGANSVEGEGLWVCPGWQCPGGRRPCLRRTGARTQDFLLPSPDRACCGLEGHSGGQQGTGVLEGPERLLHACSGESPGPETWTWRSMSCCPRGRWLLQGTSASGHACVTAGRPHLPLRSLCLLSSGGSPMGEETQAAENKCDRDGEGLSGRSRHDL